MPMHIVVLECKRFQKCVKERSKTFREFSGFFGFILIFLELNLLEGSKIFLMCSKCFIWIVHVLIYL
jgi:hypothetical protein